MVAFKLFLHDEKETPRLENVGSTFFIGLRGITAEFGARVSVSPVAPGTLMSWFQFANQVPKSASSVVVHCPGC